MARNKDPEKTRRKILDVSKQLFLEKGYDNTSIQDIINQLEGLTKGVIYHHFKSKQDILDTILTELSGDNEEESWSHNWQGNNAFEKLQNGLMREFKSYEKQKILYLARVSMKDPKMIGLLLLEDFDFTVPVITKYINEGIRDGSIVTEFPDELAEMTVLVLNTWLGRRLWYYNRKQVNNKIRFLQQTFDNMNIPLINDDMVDAFMELYDYLEQIKIAET